MYSRCYVHHNHKAAATRLFINYLAQDLAFDDATFCHKYMTWRDLFLCIVKLVCSFDLWFTLTPNAIDTANLSTFQKCIIMLLMLTYIIHANACNEYVKLGKTTTLEAMKTWVVAIHTYFDPTYLHQPTRENL